MRTITITKTLYQFDELTPDAQQKAIEKLYDINVDHDWWEFVYDDAENIGLRITRFDIDRHDIDGRFTDYAPNVAERILSEHGQNTETYKLAEQYIKARNDRTVKIMAEYCQECADYICNPSKDSMAWRILLIFDWKYEENEEDYEDINVEFERALKEEYLSILRKEYDYLTSEEAIIEAIRANDYEFDEEGNLQ